MQGGGEVHPIAPTVAIAEVGAEVVRGTVVAEDDWFLLGFIKCLKKSLIVPGDALARWVCLNLYDKESTCWEGLKALSRDSLRKGRVVFHKRRVRFGRSQLASNLEDFVCQWS